MLPVGSSVPRSCRVVPAPREERVQLPGGASSVIPALRLALLGPQWAPSSRPFCRVLMMVRVVGIFWTKGCKIQRAIALSALSGANQ